MINTLDYKDMKLENVSQGLHALLFFLPNCRPCEDFYPVVDNVSKNYPNVSFHKLNYSIHEPNYKNFVLTFEVMFYPFFVLLNEGNKVFHLSEIETFENDFQKYMDSLS
jgi:thiol-disulfide isomerase/thioredoxin